MIECHLNIRGATQRLSLLIASLGNEDKSNMYQDYHTTSDNVADSNTNVADDVVESVQGQMVVEDMFTHAISVVAPKDAGSPYEQNFEAEDKGILNADSDNMISNEAGGRIPILTKV